MVDELTNNGDCDATAMLAYNIYSYGAHCYSIVQAHNVDPEQLKFASFTSYISFIMNKASQAIQSPRTVPFFLLVSLLDGYTFANVLVKGIVAFKH